jgi:hypothetical protein
VPLGYTTADLTRLGELGRRWLALAGVGPTDVVVSLLPAGPSVAHWALVQGARRASVSTVHVGSDADPSDLAGLAPSVLVGSAREVVAALDRVHRAGHRLPNLVTLLCVGEGLPPKPADIEDAAAAAPEAAIVMAWAPAGARAVWTQCRQSVDEGRAGVTGFHTWPDAEVLEVLAGVDYRGTGPAHRGTGELLWSGLGWTGSALLRVRTDAVVTLEPGTCPSCLRPGPRVRPMDPEAAVSWRVAAVLGADQGIEVWHVERRIVDGRAELIVVLAPVAGVDPAVLVRRLDDRLAATQYVVLDAAAVRARLGSSV